MSCRSILLCLLAMAVYAGRPATSNAAEGPADRGRIVFNSGCCYGCRSNVVFRPGSLQWSVVPDVPRHGQTTIHKKRTFE